MSEALTRPAFNKRITLEAGWTTAHSLVVLDVTESTARAVVGNARIGAALVHA